MSTFVTPCVILTVLVIVLSATLASRRHHKLLSPLPIVNPVLFIDEAPLATVDENFVCATIDWWPQEKCNYGSCSWPHSSISNLDLSNPLLQKAVIALSPLLLRLGGSLEDQVIYEVGDPIYPCTPFTTSGSFTRFGFSTGCLNMSRWQELHEFFQKTRSLVAFGLNALYGRQRAGREFKGAWDSSNARDFINYTHNRSYRMKAWELGNEITGGVGTRIDPKRYAADVQELRNIIKEVYADELQKPLIVAPDGFLDQSWYKQFLEYAKQADQIPDAVGVHVYNLGPGDGVNIVARIMNGSYSGAYKGVEDVLKATRSGAKAWVGESGGIYNGGQHRVSDTFAFSFWYLDQLGRAALHSIGVFCRQTLTGGNYGLLDSDFHPNPDFYAALLWKKLMGEVVLNVTSPDLSPNVHLYAHCLKGSRGGVTYLIINFSSDAEHWFSFPGRKSDRLEYHLSSASGSLQSSKVRLNGEVLETSGDGNIPDLRGVRARAGSYGKVAPHTIAFISTPDAFASACTL